MSDFLNLIQYKYDRTWSVYLHSRKLPLPGYPTGVRGGRQVSGGVMGREFHVLNYLPDGSCLTHLARTRDEDHLAQHPCRGSEVLEAKGYSEWFRRAIFAHAPHTGDVPQTDMEKALFAVDELCGFLTACTLVLPTKSIRDLKASSVRKRVKDKAFARNVVRDDIVKGADLLGMDLDAHIEFVRAAMAEVAEDLGLAGLPS